MRRTITVPRLALVVWTSWAVLLAMMFGMLWFRIWHPHFLPITAVLAVLIVSWLALAVAELWRALCGPRRIRAVAWLLLGTTPVWLLAAHFIYGLKAGYGREFRLDLPLKALIPLGESVMDLEARFRYPQRTVGQHVVMISTPVHDAATQVANMDEHVRQLGERLDLPISGRVHWVRGPLMGMQGKAVFGMCMGTLANDATSPAGRLETMDRHEVAHCVINSMCNAWSEPPSVLIEGWAEANSGHSAEWLAARALAFRDEGEALTLAELTGPNWSGRHTWPVYVQGGPLVNYLLETFGPAKFVALYTRSHRATFASDCQAILGAGLDQIETGYWAVMERLAGGQIAYMRRRWEGVQLATRIAPEAWRAFLDDYFAQAPALIEPYDNSRVTAERQFESTDTSGRAQTFVSTLLSARCGPYRRLLVKQPHHGEAYVAHPQHSLHATLHTDDGPWETQDHPGRNPDGAYHQLCRQIDGADFLRGTAAILLQDEFRDRVDLSSLRVTDLDRYQGNGHSFVRLRLEETSAIPYLPWGTATFVFSADDRFCWQSFQYTSADRGSGKTEGELRYTRHAGTPVLQSMHSTGMTSDGHPFSNTLTVIEQYFGATPESEFAIEKLINGALVHQPAAAADELPRVSRFTASYWLALMLAAACFGGGVVCWMLT